MLKKLLKNEFKETWKVFVPILGLFIITAVSTTVIGKNLTDIWYKTVNNTYMTAAMLTHTFFYFVSTGVMTAFYIFSVMRFHKTVLSQVGYITHTLPAMVKDLILSKIIVHGGFQGIVMAVCNVVVIQNPEILNNSAGISFLQGAFGGFNGIVGIFAAMCIGFSVNRGKIPLTIGIYMGGILTTSVIGFAIKLFCYYFTSSGFYAEELHKTITTFLIPVYILIWFFVAKFFLEKRLNLE